MKEDAVIAAVIVAAGYSTRMGRPKPLLPLGHSTVLEEAVKCFRDAGIRDVRVVVGHMAETIVPMLDGLGVRWLLNDRYHMGMFSSILMGVNTLGPGVAAFFLLPVDVPLVRPSTVRHLLRACLTNPGRIIYPCFRGRRGHPPLIPKGLVPGGLPPDLAGGLRAFLAEFEERAVDVEVADEGIIRDCDNPGEYEEICRRFALKEIPTHDECLALWDLAGTPEETRAHCRLVAELAAHLAGCLNRTGFELNVDLVRAAGRLHDVARRERDHAAVGARLLEEHGYSLVGRIIARHMDLEVKDAPLDEADLIFLADKCVLGGEVLFLEERFAHTGRKYSDNPEAAASASRRFKSAKILMERFEAAAGIPLERVLREYRYGIQAVSMTREKAIYLVRHGAIRLPPGGRRFIGQSDVPLSEEGLRQANRLAETLRHLDFSAVYCSDLIRCVETARILAEPHGIVPIESPSFREIFLGRWEGLTFEEVSTQYPEEFKARGIDIANHRPPQGESFMDCASRVIPAFFDALHAAEGNILVVGHAGVNRILLCRATGAPLERLFDFQQDYGCLNVLHYGDSRLEIKLVNGIPPLTLLL